MQFIHQIREQLSDTYDPPELVGLEEQISFLSDTLASTAIHGDNNSLLLVGQRSTGKTAVVRRVIRQLKSTLEKEHNLKIYVINLNGLIHGEDEKLAVEETLHTLMKNPPQELRTYTDAMNLIISFLQGSVESEEVSQKTRVAFFILEEFDSFALLPRRQTLLYTLFNDILHAKSIRTAFIGVTCRLDATELLEKRVKSRFSHRQMNFFYLEQFQDFCKVLHNALSLPKNIVMEDAVGSDFHKQWNLSVEKLFQDKNFLAFVETRWSVSRDIRVFYNLIDLALSQLMQTQTFLQLSHFEHAVSLIHNDCNVELFKGSLVGDLVNSSGFSTLELGLIVSMKKLKEQEVTEFNFEHVFKVYDDFASKHLPQNKVSKAVAFKAFEHIHQARFIKQAKQENSSITVLNEYSKVKLMLFPSQIVQGIQLVECPTNLQKWATAWVE